jgi:hypothetical protein
MMALGYKHWTDYVIIKTLNQLDILIRLIMNMNSKHGIIVR